MASKHLKLNAGHQRGDEFSADEVEFIRAVENWKAANHRPFPRATDLLAILKAVGYRKAKTMAFPVIKVGLDSSGVLQFVEVPMGVKVEVTKQGTPVEAHAFQADPNNQSTMYFDFRGLDALLTRN